MFSSTPSVALLFLPLDVFALSHFHTPLPHMPPTKQSLGCPPHACPCMWFDKMLKGHPMMYHGACMVRLTRLPPSKHVLMLSTPLILKIKNKIRAINDFKYKFRGVFKALKKCKSKIFSDYFYVGLTGIVCLH
jgi:hypothetical protein